MENTAATTASAVLPVVEREDAAPDFTTKHGPVRVCKAPEQLAPELRRRALASQSKDFRYYEVCFETLSAQFPQHFLVLENSATGAVAVQPVFFVDQDVLEGLPRKVHALLAAPRRFFPRWLKMKMLVAGCAAGDGALDCTEPWAIESLHEALGQYARRTGAAMILLKDFPSSYRRALALFAERDYRRVPSMPGCALAFDFKSFEDFMRDRLGRKLRYKYIKLNKQPSAPMEVLTEVTPIAAELCALYEQTHARSQMRFEKLTPAFFARLGETLPDRVRYFVWRHEGRIAAFALCIIHDGAMWHLNIGFDYAVSLDLQLYYVTMRDLFRWALAEGLTRYETGQLNYDPKLHFKMRLAPLDLYARHTSLLLNPIFKIALGYLQPVRHETLLPKFPNFAEL
jgi:hypothetical protein